MYKLIISFSPEGSPVTRVQRLADGVTFIPDADSEEAIAYRAWCDAGGVPVASDAPPSPRIAEIKAELVALDIRRIRPLAEGDTSYLSTLNAQVLALRAELRGLL